MRAITIKEFGGPEVLTFTSVADPVPTPEEVLVEVHATAVNRADTLQRMGKYPPPDGESNILGLEIAGKVVKVGSKVTLWKEGDMVFGLIPGGGYSELAVIHQEMALAIPKGLSAIEAAAIPEVFLTAYQALISLSQLREKEVVLIHAGASGVGTAAIQIAKTKNATVLVTASQKKHKACLALGANYAFDYTQGPFESWALEKTQNKGVNIVIDFVGGSYFEQNINLLNTDGRMVQLATLGGTKPVNFDLRKLLKKRLKIMGSTLRSRSLSYQISLNKAFYAYAEQKFENKLLYPVIDKTYRLEEASEAHKLMESNKNTGKIVLVVK